jgi:hypothetical protein
VAVHITIVRSSMPTKRKYSRSLSGVELGSSTQDLPLPIPSTSRQLKPRSSSRSSSLSGSAQRSSSRNGSLATVNDIVDIDGESWSSASVGNSQARSKKRKVDDKGKGKGRAEASENQVVEEEIDELLSDSESAGTGLGRNRGKGKGKARYVEEENGEEVDQVHEVHVTSSPPTQPPVTHKLETSSDDIEVLSETRTPIATPPHRPEPLAQYTCPVCFCPPTKATLTPCGHILCGRCLFTAVKTTIRRGIWIGDNSAK